MYVCIDMRINTNIYHVHMYSAYCLLPVAYCLLLLFWGEGRLAAPAACAAEDEMLAVDAIGKAQEDRVLDEAAAEAEHERLTAIGNRQ